MISTILAQQEIGQMLKLPYEIMKKMSGDISFLFHKLTVHT